MLRSQWKYAIYSGWRQLQSGQYGIVIRTLIILNAIAQDADDLLSLI